MTFLPQVRSRWVEGRDLDVSQTRLGLDRSLSDWQTAELSFRPDIGPIGESVRSLLLDLDDLLLALALLASESDLDFLVSGLGCRAVSNSLENASSGIESDWICEGMR